jgi:hypothetical protein
MPSLSDQLERLLNNESNDLELEKARTTLAQAHNAEFKQLDGLWALRLYERSPYIFADFIAQHLTLGQQAIVEELLRRAEALRTVNPRAVD